MFNAIEGYEQRRVGGKNLLGQFSTGSLTVFVTKFIWIRKKSHYNIWLANENSQKFYVASFNGREFFWKIKRLKWNILNNVNVENKCYFFPDTNISLV